MTAHTHSSEVFVSAVATIPQVRLDLKIKLVKVQTGICKVK
jgi:hypothetical protein